MKNINKKGFTLVELLAVIVVLAIVMSLAVVAITNVLDSTRKNSFVADAKSFLEGAHQLVSADGVSNLFGPSSNNYAPTCAGGGTQTKFIPLEAINLDRGGVTSPYGTAYQKAKGNKSLDTAPSDGSYIKVVAETDKSDPQSPTYGSCKYTYSIFLTDTVYSIGAKGSEILESKVNTSEVKVKAS